MNRMLAKMTTAFLSACVIYGCWQWIILDNPFATIMTIFAVIVLFRQIEDGLADDGEDDE